MGPPTRSLSELGFGALLVYSPDGTEVDSRRSARAVTDIKNCVPDYLVRIGTRFEEAFGTGMFAESK